MAISIERKVEVADVKVMKGGYELVRHDGKLSLKWGQKRNHAVAMISIGDIDLKNDIPSQIEAILKELNLAFVNE